MLPEESRRRVCCGAGEVKMEVARMVENSGGRQESELDKSGRVHIDVYGNSFFTLLISTRYFDSATDNRELAPLLLISGRS